MMPVSKCSNGKWRIGAGPCRYKTKKAAEAGQRAMHARKGKKK
jgi:hypothetical protein